MTRADAALQRLAHIVPAAAREGGVPIEELARTLDVPVERIIDDVATAMDRDFYHPGGWVSDVVILASGRLLEVDRPGAFARPGKLNAREALCLSLGLHGLGASSFASPEMREALTARVDTLVVDGALDEQAKASLAIADGQAGGEEIEGTIFSCVRERRVCRLEYLTRTDRSGRRTTVERDVEPRVLAQSEGLWYALSWCRLRDAARAFRLDRVVSVRALEESFEAPEDFDADAWISERRVYQGRDETTARIRYGPDVARWAREEAVVRGFPVAEEPDGAVTVTYQVADWEWAIHHALGYGVDAEIVEPEEMRERMRAVLEGIEG